MSASELSQHEQEALVAEWLKACPGFFERHADILRDVQLKDPNRGKAISLQERQMHLLRTQNQALNERLNEMLRFGNRNDKTQELMVTWLRNLIEANNPKAVSEAIEVGLSSIFEVEVCVVLEADPIFDALHSKPICMAYEHFPTDLKDRITKAKLDDSSWKSCAILALPLAEDRFAGLLIASTDQERFSADMGAFYLKQIAGLAAAALRRVAWQTP